MESTVAHATRFRRRVGVSFRADLGGDRLGRCGGALVDAEGLAPAGAAVLVQRPERLALRRERVLDARRHLGEGVPLDDALLLERTEAQRERPRANPGQGALELAEAATALGQVANHEDR